MNIQATKLNVVQKILSVQKPSILKKINQILDREMIVAYTVDGKPLTSEDYNARLELAEKQLQNGEFLTQEELEREAENW